LRKPTALSPFRYGGFRAVWLGTLSANFGQWVQSVGAAWLMTIIAPSPDMVALVQAASSLPTLAFALIGGVLADLLDRRLVFIAGQSVMLAAAAALAVCGQLGLLTPWLLLFLTFVLGCGAALRLPSYQATVGDLVPREEVPGAVALNGVGFNLARSTGPALGGTIVAAAGAQAAFLFNAVSNLPVIIVLILWRPRRKERRLPRESIAGAMAAALRYAGQDRTTRIVLIRCLLFGAQAICAWALLPLIAKHDLGGGPLTYGMLLGCLGLGALFGAAAMPRLRHRFGTDAMVGGATAMFGLVTLLLAFLHTLLLLAPVLVIGGAAWLLVMSSFNITMQMSAPGWIKGRAIALYFTALFGGMAFGSWLWGRIATAGGVFLALVIAGAGLLALVPLGRRLRLPESGSVDTRPAHAWKPPPVAFSFDPASGPVLVTIEYLVPREQAAAFSLAMQEMRRIRRRDGARDWGLYEDVERPERWLETFTLATWLEHLRQGDRATMADVAVETRARSFHTGSSPPVVSTLIVHRPEAAGADGNDSGTLDRVRSG
jgi:MFS family permease